MLFFNAALPLLTTALCYVYVIVRLRTVVDVVPMITVQKHSVTMTTISGVGEGQGEEEGRRLVSEHATTLVREYKQHKHMTVMALLLCSLYFVLWGPSIFYYSAHSVAGHFLGQKWENSRSEKFLVYSIKYASFMCSLLSPVIYCYRHPKVRRLVRKATKGSAYRSKNTVETRL